MVVQAQRFIVFNTVGQYKGFYFCYQTCFCTLKYRLPGVISVVRLTLKIRNLSQTKGWSVGGQQKNPKLSRTQGRSVGGQQKNQSLRRRHNTAVLYVFYKLKSYQLCFCTLIYRLPGVISVVRLTLKTQILCQTQGWTVGRQRKNLKLCRTQGRTVGGRRKNQSLRRRNSTAVLYVFSKLKSYQLCFCTLIYRLPGVISVVRLTLKTQILCRTQGRFVGRQRKNLISVPDLGLVCRWATKKSITEEAE